MKKLLYLSMLLLFVLTGCTEEKKEFTVLQWNIWQEGTMIPGGYDAIVDEIIRLRPDFVTLSEVRNYNNTNFTARLTQSLKEKGETYYSFYTYDTGLLSRYPITGSTWEEIPIPTTVEEVLERNIASQRDDAIKMFIEQAKKDREAGYTIILGGDFNEPSHQDWTEETKDLYDHHGLVIPWTVPVLLDEAGFVDAYRSFYPNVLDYPGFTYPSDNPAKPAEKITWAPKADERDRIDYIWFYPEEGLTVKDAAIFGPKGSIVRSKRVQETSKDKFIEPQNVWPTDHKGVLVTFQY